MIVAQALLAQAGRYVPIPRAPGGGGLRFLPFVHGDSAYIWYILAIVVVMAAIIGGAKLGYALGRWSRGSHGGVAPLSHPASPQNPPHAELILSPEQVAAKALATSEVFARLGSQDPLFDPGQLRSFVTELFRQVQAHWQEQNYEPLRPLLMPDLLAEHERLLRSMRAHGEINRIDDLQVQRLEFVHVARPADTERHEFTALITFAAKVSFIDATTAAFRRGDTSARLYQEFWVFHRRHDAWCLHAIERSHVSSRLQLLNEAN
jgi:predicted lipid-binding transport protein (Tim44 family)